VLGILLTVAGVAVLLFGGGLFGGSGTTAQPAAPVVPETTLAPFVVEPAVELHEAEPDESEPPAADPAAGPPRRLVVPALGVNAPVIPIGAPNRVLLPPSDPRTLGWWSEGVVPGATEGGALITGHTVHTGGGAFDDLETLDRGDKVTVVTAKGRIDYRVSAISIYRKATLARDAEKVFRQTGPGRLVLITCEDWNGSTYLSNAVVFADPVPAA
jgi:LPXTG-site transpeptidase (sortase) family protein